MAFRFQAAAGVHRPLAVDAGLARERVRSAFAFLDEAEVFNRDDFRDREAIVNFRKLDVRRQSHPPSCRLFRRMLSLPETW